jgi:hypothetical protein
VGIAGMLNSIQYRNDVLAKGIAGMLNSIQYRNDVLYKVENGKWKVESEKKKLEKLEKLEKLKKLKKLKKLIINTLKARRHE